MFLFLVFVFYFFGVLVWFVLFSFCFLFDVLAFLKKKIRKSQVITIHMAVNQKRVPGLVLRQRLGVICVTVL